LPPSLPCARPRPVPTRRSSDRPVRAVAYVRGRARCASRFGPALVGEPQRAIGGALDVAGEDARHALVTDLGEVGGHVIGRRGVVDQAGDVALIRRRAGAVGAGRALHVDPAHAGGLRSLALPVLGGVLGHAYRRDGQRNLLQSAGLDPATGAVLIDDARVAHEGDLGVRGGALDALDLRAHAGDEVAGLDVDVARGLDVVQDANVHEYRAGGAVEVALGDGLIDLALEVVGPVGRGVGDRTVAGVVLDLHAGLALQARGDTDLAALAAS